MTATSSDTTAAAFDWDTIPEAIRKEMNISQEEFEEVRRCFASPIFVASQVRWCSDPTPDRRSEFRRVA